MALKLHFKGSPGRVVLAPYDVKFSEHDVVQPDLLVSCSDRPHPLMVEVLENVAGAFVTRGVYSDDHHLRSLRFPDLDLDLVEIQAALPPQPPIQGEVRETVPPAYA